MSRLLVEGDLLREVEALYYEYGETIDEEIERWPELFTENACYKAIPYENHANGLPLASILCEGRGMILDRAMAVRKTTVHIPRIMRHAITNVRITGGDREVIRSRAIFTIYETQPESATRLFLVGRYLDVVVRTDGVLRFKEKVCVFDGSLVQGSLVYPL